MIVVDTNEAVGKKVPLAVGRIGSRKDSWVSDQPFRKGWFDQGISGVIDPMIIGFFHFLVSSAGGDPVQYLAGVNWCLGYFSRLLNYLLDLFRSTSVSWFFTFCEVFIASRAAGAS